MRTPHASRIQDWGMHCFTSPFTLLHWETGDINQILPHWEQTNLMKRTPPRGTQKWHSLATFTWRLTWVLSSQTPF